MIKFFRKIRQKLLTENKFSKYLIYAIGEIILVVIGILIALQINNWNHERLNRKQEIKILIGIRDELNDLIARLDNWSQFNRTGERLTSEILNFNRTEVKKQTMDSLFSSMLFVNVFDKGGGRLETLILEGNLDLIRNNNIREKLSRWPDMLEDLHTNDLSLRNLVWGEIIPFLAQYGIPEFSCENGQVYCTQDKPISDTYLNLLKNDQFKSLMRIRNLGFTLIAKDHELKSTNAKRLLEQINAYLNSK